MERILEIVQPEKLKQVIDMVQAVVDAGCVVLVQGSNTGLTGGSVLRQTEDSCPKVQNFDMAILIDAGNCVVYLAGVGLASLKEFESANFPVRESHSILGSTFFEPNYYCRSCIRPRWDVMSEGTGVRIC
jgi:D-lactate dehydrogenase